MFRSKREKAMIAAFEGLKLEFERLTNANKELQAAVDTIQTRAHLLSIERSGRVLKFLFVRNGQLFLIETYGTLSDDVEGWKRDLLE